jgi:hypothetical protein
VIKEIIGIQRSFLWNGVKDSSKVAWVKWDVVCKSRKEGGLGVRHVKFFNWALMGKWMWRALHSPNMPWVKILAAKYGDLRAFIHSESVDQKSSLWWKDLVDILHKQVH